MTPPFTIKRTLCGWTIRDATGKAICRDTASDSGDEAWRRGMQVCRVLNQQPIAQQMSNVCFNLGQQAVSFTDRERDICRDLDRQWHQAGPVAMEVSRV